MAKQIFKRPEALKDAIFHYCPGCGHSIIHRLTAEVIDELGIRERTVGVPPAGCAVLRIRGTAISPPSALPRQFMQPTVGNG